MYLCERLAALRRQCGYSFREAAEHTRGLVSPTYLADLEHSIDANPTLRTLFALARAYELTVAQLTEGVTDTLGEAWETVNRRPAEHGR